MEQTLKELELKKWIKPDFIKNQNGLLGNGAAAAVYLALDSNLIDNLRDWRSSREDSLLVNPTPIVVETILKKIWRENYGLYKLDVFACNTSPEVVKWCIKYFESVMGDTSPFSRKNLGYDSLEFRKWVDFCRNLCRNTSASIFLLDFLKNQEKSEISGVKKDRQFIDIHTVVRSLGEGRQLEKNPELAEYLRKKVLDGTLDIDEVAPISDDLIVDLILDRIKCIKFEGRISKNTNDRLKPYLLENRFVLNIYYCISSEKDFMEDIVRERLEKGEIVRWERVGGGEYNHRFYKYMCDYYDNIGWVNCKNLLLLDKNIDKVKDLPSLNWYYLSYDSNIFDVSSAPVGHPADYMGADLGKVYDNFITQITAKSDTDPMVSFFNGLYQGKF